MPAKMAMIAITTSNSMRVNAGATKEPPAPSKRARRQQGVFISESIRVSDFEYRCCAWVSKFGMLVLEIRFSVPRRFLLQFFEQTLGPHITQVIFRLGGGKSPTGLQSAERLAGREMFRCGCL